MKDKKWLTSLGFADNAAVSAASEDFTPASIDGLSLWLDANKGISAADGGAVALWEDQSAGENDATQATEGNKPIYRATGGPNSKACLEFTNLANSSLSVNGASNILSSRNATLFFVISRGNTEAEQSFLVTDIDGDNGAVELYINITNPGSFSFFGKGADAITSTDLVNHSTFAIIGFRLIEDGTSTSAVYVNGSATTGTLQNSGRTVTTTKIGSTAAPEAPDMKVAEIIGYPSALSDANITKIGEYLATKYALTWSEA